MQAYRKQQRIVERLAAQDPTNAGWQRNLSVSHNKVGDVLRVPGDAGGALQAYRASLGIRERLAAQDPTNAEWQQDLAVLYCKLASAFREDGDLDAECDSLRQCHEMLTWMRASGMHLDPQMANVMNRLDDFFGS